MYESGDTATENAILAAALIGGKTVIKFASANYQVPRFVPFSGWLGCENGRDRNDHFDHFRPGKFESRILLSTKRGPDRSDVFFTAAIVTKSSIVIRRCPLDFWNWNYISWKKWDSRYKIVE